MFVIKYDKVSMIKLVQSIQKYPAIYDTKTHYSKDQQDKAWDEVALELGEKDSLCRERWHSIKSCYIRHLKYTALNSNRRPYYLAEYLTYLQPFVSERIKKFISLKQFQLDNLPSYLKEALPQRKSTSSFFTPDITITNEQESEIKKEVVEIEDVSEPEWLNIDLESQKPSSSKASEKKQELNDNLSSKKNNTVQLKRSNDEDANFLKSLLPDIARMSSHQKLKFKQEALSIIEDILYAADDTDITD